MATPSVPVLTTPAEVTFGVVPALDAEVDRLVGRQGRALVVDLSATQFLCSGGLGLLVKWGKQLSDRGGSLALARAQAPVQKLLRTVGLDTVLPTFPSVAAAVAHASAPASGS